MYGDVWGRLSICTYFGILSTKFAFRMQSETHGVLVRACMDTKFYLGPPSPSIVGHETGTA